MCVSLRVYWGNMTLKREGSRDHSWSFKSWVQPCDLTLPQFLHWLDGRQWEQWEDLAHRSVEGTEAGAANIWENMTQRALFQPFMCIHVYHAHWEERLGIFSCIDGENSIAWMRNVSRVTQLEADRARHSTTPWAHPFYHCDELRHAHAIIWGKCSYQCWVWRLS